MRKSGVIALAVIGLLFLGGTVLYYSKYRQSQAEFAQMTAQEHETRIKYGQAINEIAMIQDSLNTIVLGEAPLLQGHAQSEVPLPPTVRDQVLGRIATLRAGLERTKERIQTLDAKLKRNNVQISGLHKMIDGLKRNVAAREESIAQLNTQVQSLQTEVAGLTVDVNTKQMELTTKQQELTEKQRELATIFYAVGTKKELQRAGVVVAEGGVLGVGKSLKTSAQFDETRFTPLNTDQETVIRLPATHRVQILSAQPVSSYTLKITGKDEMELQITNPNEFRKVKHLVIVKA